MTKAIAVEVDNHSADFIEAQLESGRFGSADEVVLAGLRLLEQREEKLQALRDAIEEGHRSGYVENFDFDEFLAERRRNFNAEIKTKSDEF